jgi:hypothetical protein
MKKKKKKKKKKKRNCITIHKLVNFKDNSKFYPTTMGRIASYYYLHYKTAEHFSANINESLSLKDILKVLCDSSEYDELPVRHNEDVYNKTLSEQVSFIITIITIYIIIIISSILNTMIFFIIAYSNFIILFSHTSLSSAPSIEGERGRGRGT